MAGSDSRWCRRDGRRSPALSTTIACWWPSSPTPHSTACPARSGPIGARRAEVPTLPSASDPAGFKLLLEPVLRQSPPDEHETAVALLVQFPRALRSTFDQHMHALDHEALVIVLHRNDALHSKDVGPDILSDLLNPGNDTRRLDRPVVRGSTCRRMS